MNYKTNTLNDLCDVSIGRTPPRSQSKWFNSGARDDWRWISIKDMGRCGKYISNTSETITNEAKTKFNYKTAVKGTILLSFKLTLGRLAVCDGDFVTNEAIAQLPIKNPKILDRDYLYYYLKNYNWSNIGNTSSIATAINSKIIKNLKIVYPDIITQRKMSKLLSLIDAKIECNNRTNDNLLEISKTIFSNDFGGKIRGGKEIGDYLVPKRGKALLSKDAIKGDIPVIAGGLEPATFHNLSNTKAPVITISASGANAGFVNLWQREVWSSDSSFIDATITENPFFWYVMLVVRQDEIYKAQTGSAQAHIYPKHIAEMSIGDIKQSEISTYEKKVASIFEQIEQNKTENRRLTKLRDTLLPELLNGKIDISNIDI